jgi:hypothetical protein
MLSSHHFWLLGADFGEWQKRMLTTNVATAFIECDRKAGQRQLGIYRKSRR